MIFPALLELPSVVAAIPAVGVNHYLIVSALLFAIGFFGVLLRKNTLVIYMSLELMLNAATLAAVAFSRFNGMMDGNILVFFIITVAAAEVAVGLAIIVALFRKRHTVQVEELGTLKN
ncbi:MAG TPA: NADH-quinone oxidoreductase subunit NuoK [Opitutaceae bacterium]